jgi:superfamily II DNA/RNA helicase
MSTTFSELGLPAPMIDTLEREGIVSPFPVQSAAIPDVLAGRDVAARARTGSGKTLAFGLPMLATVGQAAPNKPKALILAPTRELAAQIRLDLAPYAKAMRRQVFAVFGGVRYTSQWDWLRRGVDVLVATPGRLEDLIDQRTVDLSQVNIVCIDEADRMADMGFLPAVKRILDQTSSDRQTLLFSATLDGDVGVLIKRYQNNPARHEVGGAEIQVTEATHYFWMVDHHDKVQHTADAIDASGSTIVFVKTRHGTDRLAKQLTTLGVNAVAMHGGLSQNQRIRALKSFSDGRVQALIATDVAARGIHVDDVASVIHFDIPHGHKDYLHRSGRTARAGASGTVISLLTHGEKRAVVRMQRNLDMDVQIGRPNPDVLLRPHAFSAAKQDRHSKPVEQRPERERPANPSSSYDRGDAETRRPKTKSSSQKAPRRSTPNHLPSRNDQAASGSQSVYVGNLPWRVRDDELSVLLSKFGRVSEASVKMDRRGRSKGVGFVTMSPADASKAVHELNGHKIGGRALTVRFAETRSPNA